MLSLLTRGAPHLAHLPARPCHRLSDGSRLTTASLSPLLNAALSLGCLQTMAACPTRPALLFVRSLHVRAGRRTRSLPEKGGLKKERGLFVDVSTRRQEGSVEDGERWKQSSRGFKRTPRWEWRPDQNLAAAPDDAPGGFKSPLTVVMSSRMCAPVSLLPLITLIFCLKSGVSYAQRDFRGQGSNHPPALCSDRHLLIRPQPSPNSFQLVLLPTSLYLQCPHPPPPPNGPDPFSIAPALCPRRYLQGTSVKIKLVQAENYRLGLLKSTRSLFPPFPLEEEVIVAFSHTRGF